MTEYLSRDLTCSGFFFFFCDFEVVFLFLKECNLLARVEDAGCEGCLSQERTTHET